MIITDSQRELLHEYLEEADSLIEADDVTTLELKLDIVLTDVGFDEDGELNEVGHILQNLYDEIYEQNVE